jgi:hypothetical protein
MYATPESLRNEKALTSRQGFADVLNRKIRERNGLATKRNQSI